MATKPYTVDSSLASQSVLIVSWTDLENGDDGSPYISAQFSDKCVQVTGTFGAGGNCKIEGSNQSSSPDWVILKSVHNSALNLQTSEIQQIAENPLQIRPRVSAGDETTSLTVTIVNEKQR